MKKALDSLLQYCTDIPALAELLDIALYQSNQLFTLAAVSLLRCAPTECRRGAI
jgi:hypothetical protein